MNRIGTYKTSSYINNKNVISKYNILSDSKGFYLEDVKTKYKTPLDAGALLEVIVNHEESIRKIKREEDNVRYSLELKYKDITVKIKQSGKTLDSVLKNVATIINEINANANRELYKVNMLS